MLKNVQVPEIIRVFFDAETGTCNFDTDLPWLKLAKERKIQNPKVDSENSEIGQGKK